MTDKGILGLIAGGGRLPYLVADGARKAGFKVVCVGLVDSVEAELVNHTDVYFEGVISRPGGWMRKLRKHGVRDTIMVGKVEKAQMYTPMRIIKYLPDWRAFRIWYWRLGKKDKRPQTLLRAIADELASGNIILEDSTMYIKEHLADEGIMTKIKPPQSVYDDIEFGWKLVKTICDLDIGQAIAVKEKEVIAVEAIEGTAKMIERASTLCKSGGWTLIKTARPDQDMRFDVPCVGQETIRALAEFNAKCLVVEKGKTLILDKPDTLELANKLGVAIVGH